MVDIFIAWLHSLPVVASESRTTPRYSTITGIIFCYRLKPFTGEDHVQTAGKTSVGFASIMFSLLQIAHAVFFAVI